MVNKSPVFLPLRTLFPPYGMFFQFSKMEAHLICAQLKSQFLREVLPNLTGHKQFLLLGTPRL